VGPASEPAPSNCTYFQLIIDSVSARHVIHLGGTEPEDYTAGPSRMSFEVSGTRCNHHRGAAT
jgi:hypothetical protein